GPQIPASPGHAPLPGSNATATPGQEEVTRGWPYRLGKMYYGRMTLNFRQKQLLDASLARGAGAGEERQESHILHVPAGPADCISLGWKKMPGTHRAVHQ